MYDLDMTSRDLDDLLQLLFDRLKGKKDGLALAEPAFILLDAARAQGHGAFRIHLPQYEPIILDIFISGTADSFGYDGQRALVSLCAEIPALSSEYVPAPVATGLERIHADLRAVETVLDGGQPPHDAASEAASPGIFHETASGSVVLPLVSNYYASGGLFTTSRLIRPRVELQIIGEWNPRRRQEPAVTFSHLFAEPDSPFERQIHEAIDLAERISTRILGAGTLRRLPRRYHISLPEIAAIAEAGAGKMSGGSAGLAFTALIVDLIGRLELGRAVRIAACTAFTGSVGGSGEILPVEDSSIAHKVRAVFHSTCRRLVVPEDNLPTAEAALAGLKSRHPRRELELIGARKVGEVLADPRVASVRDPAAGWVLLQRIFHWRKHIVAGVSTIAAAIALIFILPAYTDRQVASVEFTERDIVLINENGKILSKYPIGFPVRDETPYCRALLADVDGRKGNEAICLIDEDPYQSQGTQKQLHVLMFSPSGRLRSHLRFSDLDLVRPIIEPGSVKLGPKIREALTADTDGDGLPELYVMTFHGNQAPFSLTRFSFASLDTEMSTFFHSGFMREMNLMDIDGDGRVEILASGHNPDLETAVLIILDPEFLAGASPRGARLEIPGALDVAKYYISLPNSSLAKPLKFETMATICEFIANGSYLSVIVVARGIDVVFDFDETLACSGATLMDRSRGANFDPDSYEGPRGSPLKNQEAMDAQEYADEIASLIAGIRYWDGESWQDHPVVNRSYVALKTEAASPRTERASR